MSDKPTTRKLNIHRHVDAGTFLGCNVIQYIDIIAITVLVRPGAQAPNLCTPGKTITISTITILLFQKHMYMIIVHILKSNPYGKINKKIKKEACRDQLHT